VMHSSAFIQQQPRTLRPLCVCDAFKCVYSATTTEAKALRACMCVRCIQMVLFSNSLKKPRERVCV